MNDVAALHARMIDMLVAKQYLRSPSVEEAFRAVPRHTFLPGVPLAEVYSGRAVVIRQDERGTPTSSSSEPGVMAVMLEQLQPERGGRVLEVGAGTGYNAALLAYLVGDEGAVTAIDIDEGVAREARAHLIEAGFARVRVVHGDGWLGAHERAPFDLIEATVAVPDLSPHWIEQLVDGGLVLVPLQLRGGAQLLVAFRRRGERLTSDSVRGGGFMPLRGPHGARPSETEVVDGYRATLAERQSDRDFALLRDLLRTEPRRETLGDIGSWYGWYLRLALEEPRAVILSNEGPRDEWRALPGVFDAARRSLAVLDVKENGAALVSYGEASAAYRVREAMSRRPLTPEELRVEAVPIVDSDERDGAWALTRTFYRFLLWETQ